MENGNNVLFSDESKFLIGYRDKPRVWQQKQKTQGTRSVAERKTSSFGYNMGLSFCVEQIVYFWIAAQPPAQTFT